MKEHLPDYLNADTTNDFMIIGTVLDNVENALGINNKDSVFRRIGGIREGWMKRGNMTKEEHKNLKAAHTYLEKFWLSVYNRLSPNQQETFRKKLQRFTFRIMDDYTMRKIYGQIEKELQIVKLERESFMTWCENLMEANCKGCSKRHEECELHKIFEEQFIPESTWCLQNCRFAYKED